MNELLKKARAVRQKGCVTLTMNTHVTQPDKGKDPIVLKNLVKEAERRLYDTFEKRFVWPIMENLNKVADSIEWSDNLESLVIFAGADFAEFTRLPVEVTDRVVIDDTFSTREIVRALQQEFTYYILVLNRNEARLLEAFNDKLLKEVGGEFPIANPLYTTDRLMQTMKDGSDNYIAEFFNQVDKTLWDTIAADRRPVIIATESRNYDYYREHSDHPEMVIGNVRVNGDGQPAHQIVGNAWSEAAAILREGNISRLEELDTAAGGGKLVEGLTDIWNAIVQGRADTLFLRKDLHIPARIADNPDTGDQTVLPTGDSFVGGKNVTDSIVDEMIERALDAGGDVVFIDGDQLEKFGNLVLTARYSPEAEEEELAETEA